MRTTDVVRDRALALASAGAAESEAVDEIVTAAAGKRVAIVMARQELEHGESTEDAEATSRAVVLLERALEVGGWPDASTD